MENKKLLRPIVLTVFVVLAALWRVFIAGKGYSFANFTPVGAMALFGGCYFLTKPKAFIIPIAALLISDLVIMNTVYAEYSSGFLYNGWYKTYALFALVVLIGSLIKKVKPLNVLGGAIGAGLVFFIISNFFVWLGGGTNVATGLPYERSVNGLINCYTLALPFLKNALAGNIIFSGVLFGGFELAKTQFPVLNRNYSFS